VPVERAAEHFSRTMIVRLDATTHDRQHLERLHAALSKSAGTGPTAVQLEVRTASGYRVLLKTDAKLRVRPTRELAEAVEAAVGANAIRLAASNGNGE
jgi:hypothetical protein